MTLGLTNEGWWRLVVTVMVPNEGSWTLHGHMLHDGAESENEETRVGVIHQFVKRRHQRGVTAPRVGIGVAAAAAATVDVGVVHGVRVVDEVGDLLATKVGQFA